MSKRCLIVCAYAETPLKGLIKEREGDFIVCADGGYAIALREGLKPDLLIGDLDSLPPGEEPECETLRLQPEKDDTDTMACVKYALEHGFEEIVILGGIGGRLDQTFANLQTLGYCLSQGVRATLMDGRNRAFLIRDETIELKAEKGFKFSVFAWSDRAEGVSEENAKYHLDHYSMVSANPIGVSNEFLQNSARISVENGVLLVVLSKDP
ncbi:MAG: thiamine diphosphokinase [Christensenellaceae bacterium]|jgi:thiamine pyrophosphokinase|nr:thiamine diphosphokinase [Christensenellaceae bacterium]